MANILGGATFLPNLSAMLVAILAFPPNLSPMIVAILVLWTPAIQSLSETSDGCTCMDSTLVNTTEIDDELQQTPTTSSVNKMLSGPSLFNVGSSYFGEKFPRILLPQTINILLSECIYKHQVCIGQPVRIQTSPTITMLVMSTPSSIAVMKDSYIVDFDPTDDPSIPRVPIEATFIEGQPLATAPLFGFMHLVDRWQSRIQESIIQQSCMTSVYCAACNRSKPTANHLGVSTSNHSVDLSWIKPE